MDNLANDDEVNKIVERIMQQHINGVGVVSTVTDEPRQPMTIESLQVAIDMIMKGDYLQQQGVGKDWFCVVNPALVSVIKETSKEYVKVPSYVSPFFELDYIMGRRVLIVEAAPLNVEYMSEVVAKKKYPEYFED